MPNQAPADPDRGRCGGGAGDGPVRGVRVPERPGLAPAGGQERGPRLTVHRSSPDTADHAGDIRALVAEAGPLTRRCRSRPEVRGKRRETDSRSNLACTGFVPDDLDNSKRLVRAGRKWRRGDLNP